MNGYYLLNMGNIWFFFIWVGNCDIICYWQNIDKSIYSGGSVDILVGIKSNVFCVEYCMGVNLLVIFVDLIVVGK